jgi:hypothetical protein
MTFSVAIMLITRHLLIPTYDDHGATGKWWSLSHRLLGGLTRISGLGLKHQQSGLVDFMVAERVLWVQARFSETAPRTVSLVQPTVDASGPAVPWTL